jgi:hypothetical protein
MMNERLVTGIDFSKNQVDLSFLKSSGELLKRHQRFANNQIGFEKAKELIMKTLKELRAARIGHSGGDRLVWLR